VIDSSPAVGQEQMPSLVRRLDPLMQRLLRLGVPMGPNVLLTVRGRKSGEPRTAPVALLNTDGRMYVFSPFGEVNWVRNLRASGTASLRRGRWRQDVAAAELDPELSAPILEQGLRPLLRAPVMGTMIAGWYGIERGSTADDYLEAARRHPAFELRATSAT
jgi:deazaflavin-dependent oxidoreductase (nitroreductase family)